AAVAEVLRWILPVALLGFFLVCVWANYDNVFQLTKATRARKVPHGSHVSSITLVGGITGAIACWLWPEPDLKAYFWGPFLIAFPGTFGIGRGSGPDTRPPEEKAREEAEHAALMERIRLEREARERRAKDLERPLVGCILGTAVGDALGLA